MFSSGDLSALWLTLRLATVTTLALLVLGSPIAWWLSRTESRFKIFVEAVVALPLVLPPTVLGFYLLITLGPHGPGGRLAELWGGRSMAFTFSGLVLGSMIYSLPFVVPTASGRLHSSRGDARSRWPRPFVPLHSIDSSRSRCPSQGRAY